MGASPVSGARRTPSVNVGFAAHTRHVVALRLLPFLFVLYIANFVDRTNVAFAALEMSADLHFTDRVFGLAAGVFFIGYVALQIPVAVLVERWSARRTIAIIMISWGLLTVLTGLVHNAEQLYAARLLLGAAEAGFFPGVILYLSHWFIQEDRAKATANFMAAIPLSFVIGSPVAGWILGRQWFAIAGWRWLFILEGIPPVLLGTFAIFWLTDRPRQAKWLSPDQREWLAGKLEEERAAAESGQAKYSWRVLLSFPVLLLGTVGFLQNVVFYTFMFWFPTILKRSSGLSDARVGLLGVIPYIVYFLAMQINGWHSDRAQERHWHTALPIFIGAFALLGLVTLRASTALTIALFSTMCVGGAFLPTIWAMPTEILSESTAPRAVGMINALGNVAGFVGPSAFGYLGTVTGSFSTALTLMMIFSISAGLLVLRVPRPQALPREATA